MTEPTSEPLPITSRDGLEFSAALLIGAAVGLFAARALRPERTAPERMRRALRRPSRKVRRKGQNLRQSAATTARDGGRLGQELTNLAQEFVKAARSEFATRPDGPGSSRLSAAVESLRAFGARVRPDS